MDRLFWSIFSRTRPRIQVSRKLPVRPIAAVATLPLLPAALAAAAVLRALETEPATDLRSLTCDASGGEKTRVLPTLCFCLLSWCRVGGPRWALVYRRCLGKDKGKTQHKGICSL